MVITRTLARACHVGHSRPLFQGSGHIEQLDDILQKATAAIGDEFFLLPIHGADRVYRERVYCYELYHQMRRRWPKSCRYRLNGENDKAGYPDEDFKETQAKAGLARP
jgi:hypothetical protein